MDKVKIGQRHWRQLSHIKRNMPAMIRFQMKNCLFHMIGETSTITISPDKSETKEHADLVIPLLSLKLWNLDLESNTDMILQLFHLNKSFHVTI